MKLYIHPGSPNARRARIAVRESGRTCEEVVVDVAAGDNRKPDYLALNPMGKVPTLQCDDGRVILESYAIGLEVARDTALWDAERAAEIARWQFFDACHFASPMGTLTFQHLFRPAPDPDAVEAAVSDWRRYAAVAEAALNDRETLVDGGVTLADVALFASLTYADVNGAPLVDFPNLVRWRTTLSARPAFAQTAPPAR